MTHVQQSQLARRAYQSALRMLGRREYGRAELTAKLARSFAGLQREAVHEIADELEALGYLDDARCAEALIRSRIGKGYGPNYIRMQLASKGLPEALLGETADALEVDWYSVAQRAAARRMHEAAASRAGWQRAARYLQRRGFDSDMVRKALGAMPPI